MPISAEQWRVKTGMINASRGLRQLSMKPPPLLLGGLPPPPPSDWRGYILALTLLWLPLLYKVYELGVAVLMGLVRGESHVLDIEDSHYGFMDPQLHCHSWSGLVLVLINTASYLVVVMAIFLTGNHECTEQNKHQFIFLQPLCYQKFLWFDVEDGVAGGLREVPKVFSSCVYATFTIEQQSTLQCVRVPRLSVEGTRRVDSRNTTMVSFVVQLSTIALAMLLLLSGDVERNPGPILSEGDIMTLVTELKSVTSEYYKIGIRFGINPAKMEIIEQNHPNDCDAERRLTEVLLHWLRGNTDVKVHWESVIDALIKVDRIILARELAIKYCPSKITEAMAIPAYGHGKISFPTLDTSSLDDDQKQRCQKLSADMEKISEKFQDLFDSISESLEERKIPAKKIALKILTFKAYEPVYAESDSTSILAERMTELMNAKSIDDVMFIVGTYSSFFNYHLVGRIINKLGTDEDRKMLSEYEEQYRLFAERMVYECPTTFQGPADTNTQRQFMVKVDHTFEKCTLSNLERFINKLSEVLKLSEGTLLLESIRRGCLELTLQSPLFVFQRIFPLSSDQERALAALGVVKISAGDYQYPPPSQDEDGDSDDHGDKPDDGSGPGGRGDSGIDTLSTILSELSEQSEEVARVNSSDPYDIDYDNKGAMTTQTPSHHDLTPLHIAAYNGQLEYVKTIVNSGVFKVSQRDKMGNTPLHYAALNSQLAVAKYFIEEKECSSLVFGAFGETPLHIACRYRDFEMVKYLVVDQKVDPMYEDEEWHVSPFHSACIGGNIDIVHLLSKEMSTYISIKEIANEKTAKGNTALHLSIANGHFDIVKYLIVEVNCNPNLPGQEGATPLHIAALKGHLKIIKFLMYDCKCACLPNYNGLIPLHYAAREGHLDAVKLLTVDNHCDPNYRDSKQSTPLHYAVRAQQNEVVEFFINELKCDPNIVGFGGSLTPLLIAAQYGHLDTAKVLLKNKECSPTGLQEDPSPLHVEGR